MPHRCGRGAPGSGREAVAGLDAGVEPPLPQDDPQGIAGSGLGAAAEGTAVPERQGEAAGEDLRHVGRLEPRREPGDAASTPAGRSTRSRPQPLPGGIPAAPELAQQRARLPPPRGLRGQGDPRSLDPQPGRAPPSTRCSASSSRRRWSERTRRGSESSARSARSTRRRSPSALPSARTSRPRSADSEASEVVPDRDHHLGGVRGRGGADVGHQVGHGDVHLVPHRAHHRHRAGGDGAGQPPRR